MVIVVIHKFKITLHLNVYYIIALCYHGPTCKGCPRVEEFGCCGLEGDNPHNYLSGKDVPGKCYPVICM